MQSYYKPQVNSLPWNTFLDLIGWEFFFRGFILFAFVRKFGAEASGCRCAVCTGAYRQACNSRRSPRSLAALPLAGLPTGRAHLFIRF